MKNIITTALFVIATAAATAQNPVVQTCYTGCVRCVDYLCSLPEWDGKNVVCKDSSQGGALSIVTAALHEKVSLVCAAYPALCDLTGFAHGRAGGWPKYFFKESSERKTTDKVRQEVCLLL